MASIDSLKASDGSGNASVATVQNARSAGATTLIVDTVQGINTNFHGTMGTPHTFQDPVTGETITTISEATAVDFKGHVDGSNLEIDTIAPGYTDAGSEVGDIVIIKPTTQEQNEVAEILEVSHNDDGTLKANSVDTQAVVDGAVTPAKLSLGTVTANQSTSGTTTSTSFTTTLSSGGTNPSVTVTVPSTGDLLVLINARLSNSTTASSVASFALSGANTVAPSDENSIFVVGTSAASFGGHFYLTGLTPGETTLTMQYKVSSGTGTIGFRRLIVIPLG